MSDVRIELPEGWFSVAPSGTARTAVCRAIAVTSNRSFGAFAEKTLQCNRFAKDAIDQMCHEGGFTQAWARDGNDELFTMTKIPAIILVKLMLGLPEEAEAEVQSLIGAYAICMEPASKCSATRRPPRSRYFC